MKKLFSIILAVGLSLAANATTTNFWSVDTPVNPNWNAVVTKDASFAAQLAVGDRIVVHVTSLVSNEYNWYSVILRNDKGTDADDQQFQVTAVGDKVITLDAALVARYNDGFVVTASNMTIDRIDYIKLGSEETETLWTGSSNLYWGSTYITVSADQALLLSERDELVVNLSGKYSTSWMKVFLQDANGTNYTFDGHEIGIGDGNTVDCPASVTFALTSEMVTALQGGFRISGDAVTASSVVLQKAITMAPGEERVLWTGSETVNWDSKAAQTAKIGALLEVGDQIIVTVSDNNSQQNWPQIRFRSTTDNKKYVEYSLWQFSQMPHEAIFVVNAADAINMAGGFDFSGGNYTMTKVTLKKAETERSVVYFVNTNDWKNVYCYAWGGSNNGEFPGVAMSKTGYTFNGYEIWKYTNTSENVYTQCIFSNGVTGDGKVQTGDLGWGEGLVYKYNVGWMNKSLASQKTIQLKGDFNSWGEDDVLVMNADELNCSITKENVPAGLYEMKLVVDGAWKSNDLAGTMTRDNCTNWPFDHVSAGNSKIKVDIAGNYTFTYNYAAKTLSVTYPTSFDRPASANYGSLCVPFDAELTNGRAFQITSRSGNVVTITETDDLVAGHSYLIKAVDPAQGITVSKKAEGAVAGAPTNDDYHFGVLGASKTVTAADEAYVLMNNELRKVEGEGEVTVASTKAYFKLPVDQSNPGAPALLRIAEAEENATAIETIEAGETAVKFMENGQLRIKKNGVVYDVVGRVVR